MAKTLKNKKIIMIMAVLLLILASPVLAATKPIAGKVGGASGDVSLFVEVNLLDKASVCVINPLVQTGPEGDFSTNLGNLVFLNSPQTKCSGFWQPGDRIWFEINSRQSSIQQIEPGTGLQVLDTLTVTQTQPDSNGGGGGGAAPAEPTPTPTTEPSLEIDRPEISALLTAEQNQKNIQASLKINLLNNIQKYLETKVVLLDLNDQILQTEEDNFFLTKTYQKTFSFDLENLEPNHYKIQAFIYDEQGLVGTSNQVKFTLAPPLETDELVEIPASLDQTQYPFYVYIILVLIILALAVIVWRLRKNSK